MASGLMGVIHVVQRFIPMTDSKKSYLLKYVYLTDVRLPGLLNVMVYVGYLSQCKHVHSYCSCNTILYSSYMYTCKQYLKYLNSP